MANYSAQNYPQTTYSQGYNTGPRLVMRGMIPVLQEQPLNPQTFTQQPGGVTYSQPGVTYSQPGVAPPSGATITPTIMAQQLASQGVPSNLTQQVGYPGQYQQLYAGLTAVKPEPFASTIDIITAAQNMEEAIHAKDKAETKKYLKQAKTQLEHARAYLEAGINSGGDYTTQLENTIAAITILDGLIRQTGEVSSTNLPTFQQNDLYNYQGVLSSLYKSVSSLE